MAVPLEGSSSSAASFLSLETAESSSVTESLSYFGSITVLSPTQQAISPIQAGQTTWLGWLAYHLLLAAKAIPGTLVWLITFTTITIPTFLFALFSTTLTFTMNATTLSDLFQKLEKSKLM